MKNRGHESKLHKLLKEICEIKLRKLGYKLLSEQKGCDVFALKEMEIDGWQVRLGVEVELSPRNALRNVQRDFDNRCNRVLVVCPSVKIKNAVERKLYRYLQPALLDKAAVVKWKV